MEKSNLDSLKTNQYNYSPHPQQLQTVPVKNTAKTAVSKSNAKSNISNAVLAAALAASVIGTGVIYHRGKLKISNLENAISSLTKEKENLLKSVIEKPVSEINLKETTEAMRTRVLSSKLDYDELKPPIKEIETFDFSRKTNVYEYSPVHVPSTNRADKIPFEPPSINLNGNTNIEIPSGVETITKIQTESFKPISLKKTDIVENYADSAKWDTDKIARDILQNFYDGHGQTLDGVNILTEKLPNGKYKVRIEGKSTYDYEKAIYWGDSSKRENEQAAGGFGEGLKITVMKMLKNLGGENFKIGSDNWKVNYSIVPNDAKTKNVLAYSLEQTKPIDGNYVEFETNSQDFLNSLRKSINRFYHSQNPDFIKPDFENAHFGFKLLKPDEKGGLYIAGQKFEVNEEYEGLKGISIFLKEKLPDTYEHNSKKYNIFTTNRDRTSIPKDKMENIGEYLIKTGKVKPEEIPKILSALKEYLSCTNPSLIYMSRTANNISEEAVSDLARGFIRNMPNVTAIKFLDNEISFDMISSSESLLKSLLEQGKRIWNCGSLSYIGMKKLSEISQEVRQHKPLSMIKEEREKIKILREALDKLSPNLSKKLFTENELKANVYMYNRFSANENKSYNGTLGEAIVNRHYSRKVTDESLGFWLDREYLSRVSFSEALSTTLHELTHKFGGDDSSEFSYKLTDVLTEVLSSANNSPQITQELRQLNEIWNQIPLYKVSDTTGELL